MPPFHLYRGAPLSPNPSHQLALPILSPSPSHVVPKIGTAYGDRSFSPLYARRRVGGRSPDQSSSAASLDRSLGDVSTPDVCKATRHRHLWCYCLELGRPHDLEVGYVVRLCHPRSLETLTAFGLQRYEHRIPFSLPYICIE